MKIVLTESEWKTYQYEIGGQVDVITPAIAAMVVRVLSDCPVTIEREKGGRSEAHAKRN